LAKLSENGGTSLGNRVDVTPTDAYSPRSYYELKCVGPDNQIIDVSGSGWLEPTNDLVLIACSI
jgi:hypothetical protein